MKKNFTQIVWLSVTTNTKSFNIFGVISFKEIEDIKKKGRIIGITKISFVIILPKGYDILLKKNDRHIRINEEEFDTNCLVKCHKKHKKFYQD